MRKGQKRVQSVAEIAERRTMILAALHADDNIRVIAKRHGVSHQRIHQIIWTDLELSQAYVTSRARRRAVVQERALTDHAHRARRKLEGVRAWRMAQRKKNP